jgi:hypothetical protein
MPLRVFGRDALGRIACRASAEITSPTLFRSDAAISFAAARTSSSIARVVRIRPSIEHRKSIVVHRKHRIRTGRSASIATCNLQNWPFTGATYFFSGFLAK